jgi:hypothetical protein
MDKFTVYDRYQSKKGRKIAYNPLKHISNKDEAKALRRIMSRTGMSEEQIRLHPKFRKELSEIQKDGQIAKKSETEKFYQELIKEACKKTGLVPQHPDTLKVLNEIIKERSGRSWGKRFFTYRHLSTAESIVKYYSK